MPRAAKVGALLLAAAAWLVPSTSSAQCAGNTFFSNVALADVEVYTAAGKLNLSGAMAWVAHNSTGQLVSNPVGPLMDNNSSTGYITSYSIVLDLGANYAVTDIRVRPFNYNPIGGIHVSSTNLTCRYVLTGTSWNAYTQIGQIPTSINNYNAKSLGLGSYGTIRYIQFKNTPTAPVAPNTAAPVINLPTTSATHTWTVNENQSYVGQVKATDANVGQSIAYSLVGGTDQTAFNINASGHVTFNPARIPDYEYPSDADGNRSYELVVRATDNHPFTPLFDEITLTVTVADVADAPTVRAAAAEPFIRSASLTAAAYPDASAPLTAQGFVVSLKSTNPNPTVGGVGTTAWNVPTADSLQKVATGLIPSTLYAFKAYATNAYGTSYTAVQDFATTATDAAPSVSYDTLLLERNVAMTAAVPVQNGGDVPVTAAGGYRNQVNTFAGTGSEGGANGNALTTATFKNPWGIASDGLGNVYVADNHSSKIRKIFNGQVSDLASLFPSSGGLLSGMVLDRQGWLWCLATTGELFRVNATTGVVVAFGDLFNGRAHGLALSPNEDSLAVALGDPDFISVNQIVASTTVTGGKTVVAANPKIYGTTSGSSNSLVDGYRTSARFIQPQSVVWPSSGLMYVGESTCIRKIVGNTVSTLAGGIAIGRVDATGTAARFNEVYGLAVDPSGMLYAVDHGNHQIRTVSPNGVVSTWVGNINGVLGAGSAAFGLASTINKPVNVHFSNDGRVYISEFGGNRIRSAQYGGYSVAPLPLAGLVFDPASGTFSGTPTVSSTKVFASFDFNNGQTPSGMTLNGQASVVGGLLRLTPDNSGQVGAAEFANTGYGAAGNSSNLRLSFRSVLGRTGTPRADGFSYSFGGSTSLTSGPNAELGTGNGFSIAFVTFNNSTPGIRIISNPNANGSNYSTSTGTYVKYFSSAYNSDWLGKGCDFTVDLRGQYLTLYLNGTAIASQIDLGSSFAAADKSTWKHVFKARTGAEFDFHGIDNVVLEQQTSALAELHSVQVTAANHLGATSTNTYFLVADRPSVTTGSISALAHNQATVSASQVTSTGGLAGGVYGIAYGTAPAPTVANDTVVCGTGTSNSFSAVLSAVSPNTTYYFRAFSVNALGAAYGTQGTFTTLPAPPEVAYPGTHIFEINSPIVPVVPTQSGGTPTSYAVAPALPSGLVLNTTTGVLSGTPVAVTSATDYTITATNASGTDLAVVNILTQIPPQAPSVRTMVPGGVGPDFAQLGGDVFVVGSAAVAERGLLLHTAATLDLSTYTSKVVSGTGAGTYYHEASGLSPQTTYYVRAYAVNADGTGYGAVKSFTTKEGAPDFNFAATESFVAGAPVVPRGATHTGGSVPAQTYTRVKTLVGSKSATGNVDGPAATARFGAIADLVVDASGNKYVTDRVNHTVRKVDASGNVTTLAGNGTAGYAVGAGTSAQFNTPTGIALGPDGMLYVCDSKNYVVRKVDPTTGMASLYAGIPGIASNQNGKAIGGAAFSELSGIAVDGFGYVYTTSMDFQRVARISPEGTVQSFSVPNTSWNGDIAVDGTGTLYRNSANSRLVAFRFGDLQSVKSVYGSNYSHLALDPTGEYLYSLTTYFTSDALEEIHLDAFLPASSSSYDMRYRGTVAGAGQTSADTDPCIDSIGHWTTFVTPGGLGFDSDGYLWFGDGGALRRMEMHGYRLAYSSLGVAYTRTHFEKLTGPTSGSFDFKVNPRTGLVEGTPIEVGNYEHTVIASNNGGRAIRPLNLSVEWAAQWKGTVSDDWFDAANWYPAEVPGDDVNIAISSANSVNPVRLVGNVQAKNLWLQGNAVNPVPFNVAPNSAMTVTNQFNPSFAAVVLEADSTGYGNMYLNAIWQASGSNSLTRQMYFAADAGETSKTFLVSSPFGSNYQNVPMVQLMENSSTYNANNPPAWITNDPTTTPIHYWKVSGTNTNWEPLLDPQGIHNFNYHNAGNGVLGYSVFMGTKNGTTYVTSLPAVVSLRFATPSASYVFESLLSNTSTQLKNYDYDGSIAFTGAVDNKSEGSWNLIGTGKPVPYDWTGQSVPTNVGGVLRVRQGNSWRTVAKDPNANLYGSEFIPPMQAFWVPWKNKLSSTSLVFSPDNLAYHSKNKVRKTESVNAYLHLELKSDAGDLDRTLVAFHDEASEGEDFAFEAGKFFNEGSVPTLYSRAEGAAKQLNYLPHFEEDKAIPLGVSAPAGWYTFKMNETSVPQGYFAWLEDRQTNTFTLLNESDYRCELATGSENSRFVLHATTQKRSWDVVPPAVFTAWEHGDHLMVQSFRLEGKVKWSLVDASGRTVAEAPRALALNPGQQLTVELPANLVSGAYQIRVQLGDETQVVRWIRP